MQQESSEVDGENPTLLHWFWDFHHNNSSTSNWDYCHSSLEWEGGSQSLMSFWKRKNKSQTKLSTATLLSVASFATWCNPFPVVAVSLPSRSLWPVWCFLGRRWYVCIIRSPESKERNKNSSNIVLITLFLTDQENKNKVSHPHWQLHCIRLNIKGVVCIYIAQFWYGWHFMSQNKIFWVS